MPGLVPGIHVFAVHGEEGVDGRYKPGHDEFFNWIFGSAEIVNQFCTSAGTSPFRIAGMIGG
jgi:hypothetical protein